MCRIERWSTRTLQKKIDSMLFERTALSTKPEELAMLELQQVRDDDTLTLDLTLLMLKFFDVAGIGLDGKTAGDQVIPGVPVRDLDCLPRLTERLNILL